MSSARCECGFYNRDRHHTKIGGGECDFIAYRKRIAELEAQLAELREALEKLARLGNGDRYGNSEGNVIAQNALALQETPHD